MAHKIYSVNENELEEFEYDDSDILFEILNIAFANNTPLEIHIDHELITLKEYIKLIRLYDNTFKVPEDVTTSKELNEWIDAVSAIGKVENFSED
jgi:hypothetical protein